MWNSCGTSQRTVQFSFFPRQSTFLAFITNYTPTAPPICIILGLRSSEGSIIHPYHPQRMHTPFLNPHIKLYNGKDDAHWVTYTITDADTQFLNWSL